MSVPALKRAAHLTLANVAPDVSPAASASASAAAPAAGPVATPLGLAKVVAPAADAAGASRVSEGRWRVLLGRDEHLAALDGSVDPELVRGCLASGARVVVELLSPGPSDANAEATGAPLLIVGVLTTSRSLTVDRAGDVDARVRRFSLTAEEDALLRSAGAFLRLRQSDVEIYGNRVVSRARELCRVLGRMVKIN